MLVCPRTNSDCRTFLPSVFVLLLSSVSPLHLLVLYTVHWFVIKGMLWSAGPSCHLCMSKNLRNHSTTKNGVTLAALGGPSPFWIAFGAPKLLCSCPMILLSIRKLLGLFVYNT